MLERLARQTVLNLDAYEWEASSEVVAARHGLDPRDVIRFDLNTSPFPPASWDVAMEGARLERIPNEYFDTAYAELSSLIGPYCGVGMDQLVIGAGADEILDVVTKTFLDNGDPVVISVPTYSMYAICARQLGATVRTVPLGAGFALDVEAVLAAAQGAKLIFVCNPNSPTGNATDPETLERLVAAAPCMVAVDEAYVEYHGWSAIPLVARYPNLIIVRTMSKGFGLAGMRLGWGVAQPEVAALMNRVRPPNSVSMVTARVAAAALRDLSAMRAHVAAVIAERTAFANGLRTIGAHVYPSVTNFVLTRWSDPATAQAVYDWLEMRGMVVRNFARHSVIPGHLRITVRSAEENARLFGALAAWRAALVGVAG
jgi:histidinol-phosphate aminotransferase